VACPAEQREAADDLQRIIVGVVDKPFTIAEIRKAVSQALNARRIVADDAVAAIPLRRYA
jgi:hypothetical protein